MSTYEYNKKRIAKFRANPELIPERVHGTQNGYTNYGCRCSECRSAWAKSVEEAKERRASRPVPEHVHGTSNGYGNYKCRCEPCTAAWTRDSTARAARRRKARMAKESDSSE